jgi:hypothetical protein
MVTLRVKCPVIVPSQQRFYTYIARHVFTTLNFGPFFGHNQAHTIFLQLQFSLIY